MRVLRVLTILGFFTLMIGCVPSLHPLFSDKDLVLEPALVGTWIGSDGATWDFQPGTDRVYKAVYTENDAPAKFEARLGKLGKYLFVDLYPEDLELKNDFYKGHFIPTHTFTRVRIEGDTLQLDMPDPDWLKSMIEQKKIKISHEETNEVFLLTAATEDLQKFVLAHAEDEDFFSNHSEWHRRK